MELVGCFGFVKAWKINKSSKKNIFTDPEVTPGQQQDKVVAQLSLEKRQKDKEKPQGGDPTKMGGGGRQGPEDEHEAKKVDK